MARGSFGAVVVMPYFAVTAFGRVVADNVGILVADGYLEHVEAPPEAIFTRRHE